MYSNIPFLHLQERFRVSSLFLLTSGCDCLHDKRYCFSTGCDCLHDERYCFSTGCDCLHDKRYCFSTGCHFCRIAFTTCSFVG